LLCISVRVANVLVDAVLAVEPSGSCAPRCLKARRCLRFMALIDDYWSRSALALSDEFEVGFTTWCRPGLSLGEYSPALDGRGSRRDVSEVVSILGTSIIGRSLSRSA